MDEALDLSAIDRAEQKTRLATTKLLLLAVALLFLYWCYQQYRDAELAANAAKRAAIVAATAAAAADDSDDASDDDDDSGNESGGGGAAGGAANDADDFEARRLQRETRRKLRKAQWPTPVVLPPDQLTTFTHATLAVFDGVRSGATIYLALDGDVYDVTPGHEFYEPGAGYHILAGRDGTRVMGYMDMKAPTVDVDTSDITAEQQQVLDDWVKKFKEKYQIVGSLPRPAVEKGGAAPAASTAAAVVAGESSEAKKDK
jgi:membrane-associated progesterone receptor component